MWRATLVAHRAEGGDRRLPRAAQWGCDGSTYYEATGPEPRTAATLTALQRACSGCRDRDRLGHHPARAATLDRLGGPGERSFEDDTHPLVRRRAVIDNMNLNVVVKRLQHVLDPLPAEARELAAH